MATFILAGGAVVLEKEIIALGYVIVQHGKIIGFGHESELPSDDVVIRIPRDSYIIPGFIDIHVHGGYGFDVMEGEIEELAKKLPEEGVTAFLATTMTDEVGRIESALEKISTTLPKQGAELLGIHVEGPFLSKKQAGAQPIKYMKKPDVRLMEKWIELTDGQIQLVTLAPEEDIGLDVTSLLHIRGIIASVGHSDATFDEMQKAFRAGLNHATHFFNQVRGFHHREPGVVGAALLQNNCLLELIVDGHHVHPRAVELLYKQVGYERLILITDAIKAKGTEELEVLLAGQRVLVRDDRATLEDGRLAGSVLRMNEAIRNMINFTGCSICEAVMMASYNPAKHLGLHDRLGSIGRGKDADLVVLSADFNVLISMCKGEVVCNNLET